MKILYGVQGTGNGHIAPAREMAKTFNRQNADVTYLFSGRDEDQFFDMDCFGQCLYRKGLTYVIENGRVNFVKTAYRNNPLQFASEMRNLDLSPYDLILTDFEPVSAWAGKLQGKTVMGLGHQYAFGKNVPKTGDNLMARMIIKYFAPANWSIGYHWHHFGHPNIFPPVIDRHLRAKKDKNFFLVYLPFENQSMITEVLKEFKEYQFIQYHHEFSDRDTKNVSLRKTCYEGFKRDLTHCQGVICNAGFMLVSECLHMHLPLLVKPAHIHMEQLSNAEVLHSLHYAQTTNVINAGAIEEWLSSVKKPIEIDFPDVAEAIVDWILNSDHSPESLKPLHNDLWVRLPFVEPL